MPKQKEIANQLLDQKSPLNVDGLLDAVIALYNDCNFPVLKRLQNIDAFIKRNQSTITHFENSRLKRKDFDVIKVIGRGAFGEVRLVRHQDSKKVYAMKLLGKNEMLRQVDIAFFWEERDIMAHAKSEWLVQLHYAFQDKSHLYMVMEYMPGGDVLSLMTNFPFNEEWARFYVAEVVLALEAIHSMGYIHRDIKPDNMLVSSSGHIKLADFGTCVKIGRDGIVRCSSAVGCPDYMSPETLQQQGDDGIYGQELDWWSVGIFLYDMIFGDTPFYADSIAGTYAKIMNFSSNLFFPQDIPVSDGAKDLINRLLSDAKTRLGRNGVNEVKNHPFFKNDKWTFETITKSTPPYVPTLNGDDDTSHFEDVDQKETNIDDGFQTPKAFTGSQLPFIGFTYLNELGPIGAMKNFLNSVQRTSSVLSTSSHQSNLDLENQRLEEAYRTLQATLSQSDEQYTREIQAKNTTIAHLKDREAELTEVNNKLDNQVHELQQRLKQKSGVSQHEVLGVNESRKGGNGGNEYENLSREQLIQRIEREKFFKTEAIEKLFSFGISKGIADDKNLPHKPSKKNKSDTKRIREQVSMEMHKERENYKKQFAAFQDNINFMQMTLYEEQKKREELEAELRDLRILAEEFKNQKSRTTDSDVDSQSLGSRSVDASHPPPVFNGSINAKQSAGAFANKRKKMNWRRIIFNSP